jgi:hypothetical protein
MLQPPLPPREAFRVANRRLEYWRAEGWPDPVCARAARYYSEWLLSNGAWSEDAAERSLHDLLAERTEVSS